jgi:ABC-type oligopeptide transport system ATPase subunit
MMLLEVRGIRKYFLSEGELPVRAVDGVSLSVNAGENISIVGESGCGKTTLAKIIMGLLRADEGQVLFEGEDVWGYPDRERSFRRKARMVFQDPYSSLDPRYSVRNVLREALCLEPKMSRVAEEEKMRDVLAAVGLSGDILLRYPHEFSGGERQRIAIARALMTDPLFLIFDEAVSSLDVLIQKEILELLQRLQGKYRMTYLFISHNLRVVKKISQKISVMYQGKIVEYGHVSEIFDDPRHPYTKRLLSAAFKYETDNVEMLALPQDGQLVDVGKGHWVLGG